ncbi:DUF262 domain-containing protein [Salinicola lusitanus]|uniref:DUF262 domain-containing protein n=1 Tax=Salinicola lusitanus TaxID=1949085 RepID=UPI000DA20CA8|nr:DUF262 domain-containing protein [Salinicola lusitanus]
MLKDELEEAKRNVITDSVQISIGEISSMYSQEELDIIPDFQRLFRWNIEKKTAFIESILIGIPLPPAFAFENSDGTWELIDGLQRISTILEFLGVLRDPEDRTKLLAASSLTSAIYLPSLDGVSWSESVEGKTTLEKSLQLFFRRARIDFQVLKHPSDPKTKFDLFQRLNRGGEYANEQEVRTCSMVLANKDATRRIKEIAQSEKFGHLFNITDDQKEKQKDIEYLVRAISLTFRELDPKLDVQEFLDRAILDVIISESCDEVIDKVLWSVNLLHRIFGGEALLPHAEAHEGIAKRFSLRALEGILVGVARNRMAISALDDAEAFVQERVDGFWRQREVAELSASGLRGTTRILRTVPFGQKWFCPDE